MVDVLEQPYTDMQAELRFRRRGAISTHLFAVGGYILLTLVLTYPVALTLFTQVPAGGDAWHNIWNLWWVKQALVDRHVNLYHTDMLYYPDGVNLYLHTLTPTAGLLSIPLQLAGANLPAVYNLIMLFSFVLAGYGAFLLCRYVGAARWPAFVGGVVFAFSPYHFAHLYGHMNLASLQWIPFYILLLLKAVGLPGCSFTRTNAPHTVHDDAPDVDHARQNGRPLLYSACAGVLLAVNAYTDLLYAVFLAMFTGLLLAWLLLAPSERRRFREIGMGRRAGGVRALVGAGVFFVLSAPLLLPSLAEAQKGYAQPASNETLVYSSDVIQAFTPSEFHPLWGAAVAERITGLGPYMQQKPASERVVFLGYCVLALGLYAGLRLRASRSVRFWIYAAVATWVLSLGPTLQFFGRSRLPLIGGTLPLPYALLYRLPLLNVARTPSRLAVLTMLALGVLASLALTSLLMRGHTGAHSGTGRRLTWRYAAAAVGLPLLILFEFLAAPFPTVPPGWNVPIYKEIAAEGGRFALLELPLRPLGDYMAYQTVHGKPIIGGLLARQPPYPLLEQTPVLAYLLDTSPADGALQSQVANGKGVAALRDLGVKYVIMHWWLLTSEQKKQSEAKLTALLGRPPDFQYPANEVAVWKIAP